MADTQDFPEPEIENPHAVPPVIEPTDDPVPDLNDDPPPETVGSSDREEADQAQSVADEELDGEEFGLSDSTKVGSGEVDDDVPDLVDHMREMVTSGRIDMSAYRGERNDDDEDGTLGAAAEE